MASLSFGLAIDNTERPLAETSTNSRPTSKNGGAGTFTSLTVAPFCMRLTIAKPASGVPEDDSAVA